MKIMTNVVAKTWGGRHRRWVAYDEDDCEKVFRNGETEYECGPIGKGMTEQEARADLQKKIEEKGDKIEPEVNH